MDRKTSLILFRGLPGIYMLGAFLYLLLMVRPVFYFHYVQPPFLLTSNFLAGYLNDPGGISQWLALLFMQSFHWQVLGPLIFFYLALTVWILTLKLMNRIRRNPSNVLLALLPFTMTIVLANNYNFPFSVLISQIFILLAVWMLTARSKSLLYKLLFFTVGAVLTCFPDRFSR